MPPARPDVTIVGAGPAGSVAAVALARRGWRVTLLEQHRFPRDKVCGECLSAVGLDVLARHDLLAAIEPLAPARLRRSVFVAQDGRAVTVPLPREMWGVTRRALDARLLDAARAAGAVVRQPSRCERLDTAADQPRLRVRDLDSNVLTEDEPSFVLLADGKAALGAGPRPKPTGDLGIKSHFRDVCARGDAIVLFGARGHYGGVAPVESGTWNVALNVPAARLREHDGDLERVFAAMASENPALARMFAGATRVVPWLASPLPRFAVTRDWPNRVIPIGNAAAALEPIGGEGMGLAMRSAELAAEALDKAHLHRERVDVQSLQRAYARLWRVRRTICRAGAIAIGVPTLAAAALDAMSSSETLSRLALRLAGK